MAEEKKDQELLKPRDLVFLEEYFKDFSGSKALIRTKERLGEPPFANPGSAASSAWSMLQRQDIKDEVELRLHAWRAARAITVEQFGQQLLDAARVEITDFFNDDGSLKSFADMPPHARKQIAAIEFDVERVKTGTNPITDDPEYETVRVPKIKLWDRRKAEELYGKWKKMFTDKVEVAGEGGGAVKVAFSLNGIAK